MPYSVKSAEDRAPLIKNMMNEITNLEPPGIQPIKQVDLFTKWRKLLKPCPKPADDVLDGERKRKRGKTWADTLKKKPEQLIVLIIKSKCLIHNDIQCNNILFNDDKKYGNAVFC